ncbi:MAG: hypothetical protein A3D52_02170 [Candidatus Taylorbacteria bacterium RIFCSPHIGHO2_02_FULL_44_36]|uniref:DUF5673 domain-containing protein n=1 Tax=Candidatus Taylorbacteria bacterium RIFCSPLOWO2_12_FULL_44_15c TaxID=1802333 RepID=A0A1G2P8X1_9BACT|nr:MAG: hypothetical protein A3D52_02170 [Candidatus Taylorbacteria bacterium RIFCSPHIGHO2_02_FULL_44_36]OHA38326.1 MAG: hypothetical protein A3I97_02295 [Candidatus Taylorbacteria bacterium RIFCSPLOWO2_02_FULL_44_35]OHA44042.1 MAG: hypothetical protein A3G03_00600 [Candidatus Taylorbacteria bacterium RIFCSPLOWO2_12_FULL_44_15c]
METKKTIAWQTLEYQLRARSGDWFWAIGIVAVSLAITAILFKNFLFGILIIIAAFALILQAVRKPRLIQFTIKQTAVVAGQVVYPFSSLESFWLDETNPADVRLLLKSKNLTAMLIVIPLGDTESQTVKDFLAQYINEEELHEPLAQKIMEALGF